GTARLCDHYRGGYPLCPRGQSALSSQTEMYILKANNLVKVYNGRTVVNHVSFHVSEGEIVGLLGRNGAGKTTSFRMVMGMTTPDEGQVIFNGQEVTHLPMYHRAKRGMG